VKPRAYHGPCGKINSDATQTVADPNVAPPSNAVRDLRATRPGGGAITASGHVVSSAGRRIEAELTARGWSSGRDRHWMVEAQHALGMMVAMPGRHRRV
jgi:hypothetical protein